MATEFDDLSKIRHVEPQDPLAAKVTSQPTRALELRLNQLEAQFQSFSQSSQFSKLVIPNVAVKTGLEGVVVDDIVYYNSNTGLYEKAIAGATLVSGLYSYNPSALALGVCVALNGAKGDIMIAGYDTWRDEAHKVQMLESGEVYVPGVTYYLSGAQPGKMTHYPPAMKIQVIVGTNAHYVLETSYANPDSLDSPVKQAIGMRPVGSLRKNPPNFAQSLIVAFDGIEWIQQDTDPAHDPTFQRGYGIWRSTEQSEVDDIAKFGYLAADANCSQQPSAPVYIRVQVEKTSGLIYIFQATTLAELYKTSSNAYNLITGAPSLAAGNEHTTREYSVMAADKLTTIGRVYFKFVSADLSLRRDVIFKFPDSFQGWKMVNAPVSPIAEPIVSGGAIISVVVKEGGVGYDTPPIVVVDLNGGGGAGFSGTAVLDQNGSITSVVVNNPGAGYDTPLIVFDNEINAINVVNGGDGAVVTAMTRPTATALVSGGEVTSIMVVSGGIGYTVPPTVVINGDGAAAAAHAIMNDVGSIISIVIDNVGAGYTAATVAFDDLPTNDQIVGFVINAPGVGYNSPPSLVINDSVGNGVDAVGAAITRNGEVVGARVVSQGSGYMAPQVVVRPNANFGYAKTKLGDYTVVLAADVVASVTVNDGGWGHPIGCTMEIVGNGAGALITPVLDADGIVLSITVDNGGTGYSGLPTVLTVDVIDPRLVLIGGDTLTPATGTVDLPSLRLEWVEILSSGAGYAADTTVAFPAPAGPGHEPVVKFEVDADGRLTKAIVLDTGVGYDLEPAGTLVDGGVAGSHGLVKCHFGAPVFTATVVTPGSGYKSIPRAYAGSPVKIVEIEETGSLYDPLLPPAVDFTAPEDIAGTTATGTVVMGGQVTSVLVTAPGAGYAAPGAASVSFNNAGTGGTGASANPIIVGGSVMGIELLDGGHDYATPPIATIVGGGGAGCTLSAVIGDVGGVIGVTLTNQGSGYIAPPLLAIEAPSAAGGIGAQASAKLWGEGAVLEVDMAGNGGLQFLQATVQAQGNYLQPYDYNDDCSDNVSTEIRRPRQAVFYYNMKADPLLKSRYPSIPPEKTLFVLNGTELNVSAYNETIGTLLTPDADVGMFRKSPLWTTFDCSACPWDLEYRGIITEIETNGPDAIIGISGPYDYPDSWFKFWEHLDKYQPARNIGWVHINKGSRFYQTGKVVSLGVYSPLLLTDQATGAQSRSDGTPMTGQLLLTMENQATFLSGTSGILVDLSVSNAIVPVYRNITGRPIVISSIVLIVVGQVNGATIPTVTDCAKITVGTQNGAYRDVIGTIDPQSNSQQGVETKLYAIDQSKELYPDARDAAPLLMPNIDLFIRVDAPANNMNSQNVSVRVRGYPI